MGFWSPRIIHVSVQVVRTEAWLLWSESAAILPPPFPSEIGAFLPRRARKALCWDFVSLGQRRTWRCSSCSAPRPAQLGPQGFWPQHEAASFLGVIRCDQTAKELPQSAIRAKTLRRRIARGHSLWKACPRVGSADLNAVKGCMLLTGLACFPLWPGSREPAGK